MNPFPYEIISKTSSLVVIFVSRSDLAVERDFVFFFLLHFCCLVYTLSLSLMMVVVLFFNWTLLLFTVYFYTFFDQKTNQDKRRQQCMNERTVVVIQVRRSSFISLCVVAVSLLPLLPHNTMQRRCLGRDHSLSLSFVFIKGKSD